ncbi:transcriptional repressor LexA [Fuchsiella alkaliacetigena]|uniref:transcriptional repressor LexA n=1 Tax=Fuchsiella alkaliacetigena TaxID=957042 RepID=UPI00200A31D7|nr:transcriptional repressor LexA [Fuchsiella alkaliacetigena]MCK8826020.1 transcriptional repressor LexA [Fuchsiella alkaliacetigena]
MYLNVEQKKIIRSEPNGHRLVKGVAGSGKSTVGIHRIPFLLENFCEKDDSILFVTFGSTLIKYIGYLYKKAENESNKNYQSFERSSKVEIKTVNSLVARYYHRYKKEDEKAKIIRKSRKRKIIKDGIAKLKEQYPDVSILNQNNIGFLANEIEWIKGCNYLELEEYQNANRLGRGTQEKDGPQRLNKNSDSRKSIFELMEYYNKKSREEKRIDYKDMEIEALNIVKSNKVDQYTHLIIDECQDLNKVQLLFLKELYDDTKDYSSITFLSDTAQSIYSQAWLVNGRPFTSIGFDMTGKSNILSKNYRTTTQIAETAYSFIENDNNIIDDEHFVKPSLIDKQGSYPIYKRFSTDEEQTNFLIQEIENKLKVNYDYKDIAIVARTKNQLNNLKDELTNRNTPAEIIKTNSEPDFDNNTIKLLTIHSIKGLEFKVVMIIGINEGVIPYYTKGSNKKQEETSERKLLYVGMTRATELLYLSSSDTPSKFISEIDFNLLRLDTKSKICSFYKVCSSDYKFEEKLNDKYSAEEKVRQWLVNELLNTYKYPKELLEIEYKVKSFSKTGYVDLAIFKYNENNKRQPYIFIEVKSLNESLDDGLKQLKSYMSNNKFCQFGAVTNGNKFIVINKDFEPINDIPEFDNSMLAKGIEELEYININKNSTYMIRRNKDFPKEIEIDNNKYPSEKLKKLSTYGDISAGEEIFINQDITEEFYMPKNWFNSYYDNFILKVKGNSMINANINSGDYVVIKKQNNAQNSQIVAVYLNEGVTLKRYREMGNTILLIPENEDYEPIQMNNGNVHILGVVEGIIKPKC